MEKDIRIVLKGKSPERFAEAKAMVERELGITLRDNEFAARVLTQAITQQLERKQ